MGWFNRGKGGKKSFPSFFNKKDKDWTAPRLELVEPKLNWIDSMWLNRSVDDHVKKKQQKGNTYDDDRYKKIIKSHFVDDIYGLYYNSPETLKLAKRGPGNEFRYKLLEKINRSGIKILSNRNSFAATLFTQEIANYIYQLYKELDEEQLKKLEQRMEGQCDGGDPNDQDEQEDGDGDGEPKDKKNKDNKGNQNKSPGKGDSDEAFDELLKDMLDSSKSDQMLEDAIKEAEKKLELADQAGLDVNESNAKDMVGKMDLLENSRREIAQLNISKEAILKATKYIMNHSTTYFSHRYKVKEVDIFEAEDLLGMEGIEFLHPIFRNGMLQDIVAREKKYIGKYDLIVDESGSMSSSACLPGHGNVSNILLAKAIALRMKRMDLLNDLYGFQDSVYRLQNDEFGILGMGAKGGTNLNNVVRKVIQTGNNSVVLTDGEDRVDQYSEKVFFIGVGGVNFHYFQSTDVGKKYIEHGQCVIFNGTELKYPKVGEITRY